MKVNASCGQFTPTQLSIANAIKRLPSGAEYRNPTVVNLRHKVGCREISLSQQFSPIELGLCLDAVRLTLRKLLHSVKCLLRAKAQLLFRPLARRQCR